MLRLRDPGERSSSTRRARSCRRTSARRSPAPDGGAASTLQPGDAATADARFSPDVPGDRRASRAGTPAEPKSSYVLPASPPPATATGRRAAIDAADVRSCEHGSLSFAQFATRARDPQRRLTARAFHQPLVRAEAELLRRARARRACAAPSGESGVRAVLDDLAHELDAEPAAAVLVEHVDVGEVDEAGGVAVDRAAKPTCAPSW